MNTESNVCGRCGTEVGAYEVCRACGAVYTRHVGRAIRGVACLVFGVPAALIGVAYLFSGYSTGSNSDLLTLLVILGGIVAIRFGMKHIRDGGRKRWWRAS